MAGDRHCCFVRFDDAWHRGQVIRPHVVEMNAQRWRDMVKGVVNQRCIFGHSMIGQANMKYPVRGCGVKDLGGGKSRMIDRHVARRRRQRQLRRRCGPDAGTGCLDILA